MRTGALILGIIAGLAGLVSAVLALFVGGLFPEHVEKVRGG
jgi:hypothetical protein